MTAPRLLCLTALAALLGAACNDDLEVPNRAPVASFDSLEVAPCGATCAEPDGGVVEIYYRLLDFDGDDVDIELSVCLAAECLTVPTAAPGGDGTTSLPTIPDQRVLHLFRWAAGCDVTAAEFQASAIIHIVPADEDPGPAAESETFTLAELGLAEGCPIGP